MALINKMKMKMSVTDKIPVVLLITSLLFGACAKRINRNCRIVASTLNPFDDTTRVYYRDNGKVRKVETGISITEFNYSGNQLTAIRTDTGRFTSRTVVDINSAGLATNVRVYFDEAGNTWANTAYEYDGEEVNKKTFTSSAGGREDITTYTWIDHNIYSSTSNGNTTNWQYFSPFQYKQQVGDYMSYQELINGYAVYRTKDLLWTGDRAQFINYEFNGNANISAVSFNVGNTRFTLKYEYECN